MVGDRDRRRVETGIAPRSSVQFRYVSFLRRCSLLRTGQLETRVLCFVQWASIISPSLAGSELGGFRQLVELHRLQVRSSLRPWREGVLFHGAHGQVQVSAMVDAADEIDRLELVECPQEACVRR